MKLVQLRVLSDAAVESVAASFDSLPHTTHKDGKYRLRRYAVVKLHSAFWNTEREPIPTGLEITNLHKADFIQSTKFNQHQGNMLRCFEEISENVLQSKGLKEMCSLFKEENGLPEGQEIDIHQMRVITHEEEFGDATPVSPEGVHQDGFDHIAMIGINRNNIAGGHLLAYEKKDSDPFLTHKLKKGHMLMLNDRKLWHNATPLKKIDKSQQGYGDWFILCAKKN